MADQHSSQGLEFIGEFSQDIRKDNGCRTGNLNDTLMQGDLGVEGRGAVAHAIRPTHRSLDHVADLHLDDQRDDAGVREVDPVDFLPGLRHHGTEIKAGRLEVTLSRHEMCFAEAS